MRKLSLLFLITFALTIAFTYTASAVKIISPSIGIESWLCAAVPATGDAVASGHVKDWIKDNGGVGEVAMSDPANGPEAGDLIGKIDKKYAWKEIKGDKANSYVLDFENAAVGWSADNITAYMYLYVTSDKARTVNIYGGSDDTIKIWVNGKVVMDNPALRGWAVDQDTAKDVPLKAGKNGILVKVVDQGGGWAGWCRIDPIEGLKTSITKKADGAAIPPPTTQNIFFDQFLMLLGPNSKAGAALDAQKEDLIATWSKGAYSEANVALGKGANRGVQVGAEKWTEAKFPDFGSDNLQGVCEKIFKKVGAQDNFTWYGYTVILSPNDRDVELKTGSDDACKLWLNGKVIQDVPLLRGASGFLEGAKVKLNKGFNTVLFKACEEGGGASAFLGLTDIAMYNGLTVDSSLTAVSYAGKLPSTWGDIKKK